MLTLHERKMEDLKNARPMNELVDSVADPPRLMIYKLEIQQMLLHDNGKVVIAKFNFL